MNKKVYHTLEFDKIIDQLVGFADSEPGKRICRRLTPKTDPELIDRLQKETSDALAYLLRGQNFSFSGNKDIAFLTKHLQTGGMMNSRDLLMMAALLETAATVKAQEGEIEDSLTPYFAALTPLPSLVQRVRDCILAEDEFADDASPALKKIRQKTVQAGEKIRTQLNSMVNGSYRTYLMDAVITMRDNRYCLPVKAEYKNTVTGIVHDQSSSGSTFFIEPAAIVELNNKLKQYAIEEEEEIERILAELTALFAPQAEIIGENAKTLTHMDAIFARARLALSQNATQPIMEKEGDIHIRKGRHPLLDPKKVVPIDLTLGGDFSQLIVTGPNTGGKTVSLKTMGLFHLMGQSGLHIPALDRSSLRIFTQIYADIGDEQSIEQSLSTFSSHMTNIVYILERADKDTLCLFDELCAGTDPSEGAALAISILSDLLNRGTCTMATTHYSELKLYALSTKGVENGGCEFNVETLSPTYRLLIGIPGKSNAFAISGKLGLSETIIDDAKHRMSAEETSFEDVISSLEHNRIRMEEDRLLMDEQKAALDAREEKLNELSDKLEAQKATIIHDATEEARDILKEAKDVADETIRSFHKYGQTLSMHEMEEKRQNLGKEILRKNEKLAVKKTPVAKVKRLRIEDLQVGDRVHVNSLNLDGTLQSLPDKSGNVFVQCGIIRSKVKTSELSAAIAAEPKKELGPKSQTSKIKMQKSYNVSPEINLIGKKVDEALSLLDKYLDDAYMSHLTSVRIVHGKGTGALRQAVCDHLRRQSYIASFRAGEYGEGDAGVTIATFK
ncbi:MAG: endonuclease MutS2 [Lachnospiraceae bacterium]|nr:endonuclease MutS2 [Lachnospiraceae bacterium]